MTPSTDNLLDPSRRWRVVLRHHQAGQFGAFAFGAGGVADVSGGRLLLRLIAAFGPDIESVTEIREQQASAAGEVPDVSPAASVPSMPNERTEHIRALRAEGLSWQQVGERLGISRERARQLGRDAREAAADALPASTSLTSSGSP